MNACYLVDFSTRTTTIL